ncbi:MAG: SelB C-terminal domain-containing protein, partial [Acidimicrobiales bacterium]|nr:SelB C-terminal domain-containing protein [Acidimicrobiales bacterium]
SACVFVVAATEGWKAQSEEHLRILDLLAVPRGMVALTKKELAGPDATATAGRDIAARLRGTFLAGAEVVPVDVPAGRGLPEIQAALDRLLASAPPVEDKGRPRLWIDRSFAIRGAGCVVTGTLLGGSLAVGQAVKVEPGGRSARVKALQLNHQSVSEAEPGHRVAVNLSGLSHHGLERGQALVEPGRWHVTDCFDASLSVLASLPDPLTSRGAFAVSVGAAEHPVRVRLLGGANEIEPGDSGFVRVRLIGAAGPGGLPLLPGDRYVLREWGRSALVGGGEVLDVAPVLPRRKAAPTRSVERVIDERGWLRADELERLTGEKRAPTVGPWVMAEAVTEKIRTELTGLAHEAGPVGADLARLSPVQRDVLDAGVVGVIVRNGRLLDAGVDPDGLGSDERRVLAQLESGGFQPPDLPLSDRAVLRSLERRGLAFESDGIWFSAATVGRAVELLRPMLSGPGVSVSEARQVLDTTRKYALPLLKYLDTHGITRRHDDRRTAGPRLASHG